MKKDKKISKEQFAYVLLLIITAVFVFSPVLLYIPALNKALTIFLYPLKTQELKSSYVGAIGALIGTFLAITGALWTQRKIDSKSIEKENRHKFIVVYYDFKFIFGDLKSIFYEKDKESDKYYASEICQKKVNANMENNGIENLYIDKEWIGNVAALNSEIEANILEKIFKIYGEISTIKKILEDGKVDVHKKRIEHILKQIYEVEDGGEIVLSRTYREIMLLIKEKAQIKDS